MKKILILAIFTTQIISCGVGTIEMQPEVTKLIIQNRSSVNLLNVEWNAEFIGHIKAHSFSDTILVSAGQGPVSFEVAGNKYKTCGTALAKAEKYRRNNFALGPSTPLESADKHCMEITLGQLGEESDED